jgi:hypothetical protein
MTADGLLRQFVAGVAAAEKKYKGKYVKVSGRVGSKYGGGNGGIIEGPSFDLINTSPYPGKFIVCVFDTDEKMKPFWTKKEEVTVIGQCDGIVLSLSARPMILDHAAVHKSAP